jgi:hypothetical protein
MRRLLLALPALALAAAPSAIAEAPAATTPGFDLIITVRSIETSSVPDDRPPSGFSRGDRLLTRDKLLNVAGQFGKRGGVVVGTDAGVLTLTSKTTGIVTGYATLPGGRIHFRGAVRLQGGANAVFKVDGGSGKYAHVTGILAVGSGDRPLNVYHLRLPVKSSPFV